LATAPAADSANHAEQGIASDLLERGWSVCPDFLAAPAWQRLALETAEAWRTGGFRRGAVGTGPTRQVMPGVRSDYVRWLEPHGCTRTQGACLRALEGLRLAINRQLFLGLYAYEGHLTVYPPGACYGRHLDQFRGARHRQLSCILYLNRRWTAGDGGQLRLYLGPDGAEPHVDILPRGGTLVCFLSAGFHHEVLPARRRRMSITGWFRTRA